VKLNKRTFASAISLVPRSHKWKTIKKTTDGLEISMLSHPSDPNCPYVRMSASVPATQHDLWHYLSLPKWDVTMKSMDPFYESVSIIDESKYGNTHMVLARKKTKRLLAFGKRDFTFISVSDLESMKYNVWISGTVSVVTQRIPRVKEYTRAFQDSIAFYEKTDPVEFSVDGRTYLVPNTKLTIVCRIDLNDNSEDGGGGNIPMWIYTKTVGSTGAISLRNMRNDLIQNLEKKITNGKFEALNNR